MSTTDTSSETSTQAREAGSVDMKLEIDVLAVRLTSTEPSSSISAWGWRLDDDVAPLEGLRIVQFTPPGSGTSITFGQGLTTAAPGSAEAGLVVADVEAAHDELVGRGIDVSEAWTARRSPSRHASPVPIPSAQATGPFAPSTIPTATSG